MAGSYKQAPSIGGKKTGLARASFCSAIITSRRNEIEIINISEKRSRQVIDFSKAGMDGVPGVLIKS
jgi:hypothetical protein